MTTPDTLTILADPLAAVSAVFAAHAHDKSLDVASDYGIVSYFSEAFHKREEREKIPLLNNLTTSQLRSGQLVRFVAMVQDSSYAQEIFVGASRNADTKAWTCHRYGNDRETEDLDLYSPDLVLDERNCIYATSIPGATSWLEKDSPEDYLAQLSMDDTTLLRGDKERIVSQGQREVAAIVKCYANIENTVKVCDIVDIIGILETSDVAAAVEVEDERAIVLHAISLQKKELKGIVKERFPILSSEEVREARNQFIAYLGHFLSDPLVAELILLSLSSHISHRTLPNPIGQLLLNIHGVTNKQLVTQLIALLRSLLPAVVTLNISIDGLNKEKLFANNDGEKLKAGNGEFVKGTVLVIDETEMKEGTLDDIGVKNIQFLNRLVRSQTLAFEFPFSEFEIETEVCVIILGHTRSLLPVDMSVPIKSEASTSNSPIALNEIELKLLRTYLLQISSATVDIPQPIAEEMQNSFVIHRKSASTQNKVNGIDEKWFGLRITVAKALARTMGRIEMTIHDWTRAIDVCDEVDGRLK